MTFPPRTLTIHFSTCTMTPTTSALNFYKKPSTGFTLPHMPTSPLSSGTIPITPRIRTIFFLLRANTFLDTKDAQTPAVYASIPELFQYYWQRIEPFHWLPDNKEEFRVAFCYIATCIHNFTDAARHSNHDVPSRLNSPDFTTSKFYLWLRPAIARLRHRIFAHSRHFKIPIPCPTINPDFST